MHDEPDMEHIRSLETDATVLCPYCGETVEIVVDPAGGFRQEYVEDCEVCCQPWRVLVCYDSTGSVSVSVGEIQ